MSKTISLVCKWMDVCGSQPANGLENHPPIITRAPIMPKNKRTQIPPMSARICPDITPIEKFSTRDMNVMNVLFSSSEEDCI